MEPPQLAQGKYHLKILNWFVVYQAPTQKCRCTLQDAQVCLLSVLSHFAFLIKSLSH